MVSKYYKINQESPGSNSFKSFELYLYMYSLFSCFLTYLININFINFFLVSCSVCPWRFQKSVRKHKDPTTGNSFIHRNIKIARDYRAVKLSCSDWCGLHHSTHRKGHQFTREAVDEISEACFSGDPRASCVGPQHDRGRSYTVMISMNFDSYANLAIFCIIPGPVLFLNSNFIYYTSVSCVSVLLLYVSLQSHWAWKVLKLGLSISYSL